jgi:uncharacterized protein
MDGAAVIPDGRGYFLAQTRRMRPEVAAPVSNSPTRGGLRRIRRRQRAVSTASSRACAVPLGHSGNATASPEEAAVVVALVRDLVGREWTPEADAPARRSRRAISSS